MNSLRGRSLYFIFSTFFVIQIDKLNITYFQSTQMLCFLFFAGVHSIFVTLLCASRMNYSVSVFGVKKRHLKQVSLLKCQMYCSDTCVFRSALNFFAILSAAPAHRTHFVLLNGNDFS